MTAGGWASPVETAMTRILVIGRAGQLATALAEKSWPMFKEWGAIRHVECWSDDVPHGQTTDFFRAVNAMPGERLNRFANSSKLNGNDSPSPLPTANWK